MYTLKRHGGWKSDNVAEGYVETSVQNKKIIATKIMGSSDTLRSTSIVMVEKPSINLETASGNPLAPLEWCEQKSGNQRGTGSSRPTVGGALFWNRKGSLGGDVQSVCGCCVVAWRSTNKGRNQNHPGSPPRIAHRSNGFTTPGHEPNVSSGCSPHIDARSAFINTLGSVKVTRVAFELCQTHFEVSKCQFKLNLKMDPELYSTRSGGLTLAQLIDFLEEDDFSSRPDVFILPPDNGNETEANSDENHDEQLGNINHLPRGILNQSFEIQEEEFESDD
ncbi:hypothetical protein GEV33_004597 [Tenebrio molitor]|uniref:Uncharacterized protein n=1 Tax=Tenebrio molitor TaxID=7067 RepID=A0A8J6HP42_TENMO|nr:hypothetical protein GEV33_004597 [Tenebrio molitor]